jgi:hypothetical protein
MDEQEGQWDYIEVQTDTLCQIVVHTGFLLVVTLSLRLVLVETRLSVCPTRGGTILSFFLETGILIPPVCIFLSSRGLTKTLHLTMMNRVNHDYIIVWMSSKNSFLERV